MVKAQAHHPLALVDTLKQGRHYSSQGPLIENVTVDGDFVEITCSPASRQIGASLRGELVPAG